MVEIIPSEDQIHRRNRRSEMEKELTGEANIKIREDARAIMVEVERLILACDNFPWVGLAVWVGLTELLSTCGYPWDDLEQGMREARNG
jgi:hypothetical protein